MTSSWTSGYVADVTYIEGFYSQQSPARMALACLIGGVSAEIARPDDPVHYLELGCGIGIGALLIAAANPGWQITAIDYNPAHIAIGTSLARAAKLANIRFLEADLTQLAGSALAQTIPMADFVSMHGLWTWVGPEVRAGIVRLLAEKTVPGAMVHISYNAMPSWQGGLALQRIIYEGGQRAGGRSDRQAEAGLALARELKATEAQYLNESSLARDLIDTTGEMSREYLSHEYMNAFWAPAFHADVAAAMAQAKLDWVAAANPLENFPELMLTAEQRAVINRYDDPIMRELIKDTCLPRQLRHDVYVRGARRIGNAARDEAIMRLAVVPIISAGELQTALRVPTGTAEMSDAQKGMMLAALQRPTTIGDLLASDPGRSNPSELVGVLIGSTQYQIMTQRDYPQPESANRLNGVLGTRVRSIAGPSSSGGLACARLGTALAAAPLIQFIAARLLGGETEADAPAWIAALSADILPEKHETVANVVRTAMEQRVPLLRQLGIVPGK